MENQKFKEYTYKGQLFKYFDPYKESDYKKLKEDDKNRIWYVKRICYLLDIDDPSEIKYLTDDIRNLAEFYTIEACLDGSNWINEIQKKDPIHEHRKKEAFIKSRDKFISQCRSIGLTQVANDLLKIDYTPYEIFTNYENVMKIQKEKLFRMLTIELKTGKPRAKELTKILNYYPYINKNS
jgi:hypothetical protein